MFLRFQSVSGDCLGRLLLFVHGDENLARTTSPGVSIDRFDYVVHVKLVQVNQGNDGHCNYDIGLEVREWVPGDGFDKKEHVDSKYLLRVYEILGGAR